MHDKHLAQVDLNLLPALVALLEERHVSRAAERVNLSQPAMSRALQRLRHALADELLIRGAGGYILTRRAERLQSQLDDLLPQLSSLFTTEAFDPSEAEQPFRLAGTDYAVNTFGPALFRRILAASPHSTLRFDRWHDGVLDDVERGAIDLVFFGVGSPPSLRSEILFEDRFVCLVSSDHPLAAKESLTLSEYLQCAHVLVAVENGEQPAIDQRLRALGTSRAAVLTVPYHTTALYAIDGTHLVATLPARLVRSSAAAEGRRVLTAPQEITTMTYSMSWHRRLDHDPAHRWLRETIRAAVDD
ncbi:LysR family transcriptional regulator [Pseudonocardia sp. CNS-004]|nr:LysR family transcriptional regulator [Pseudonocardia sp. CNS-004]